MQCTQSLKISAVAPLRGAAKPSARSSVLVAAVASGSSKTEARVAFATAAAAVLLLSSEPAFAVVAKKGADAGALALANSLEAGLAAKQSKKQSKNFGQSAPPVSYSSSAKAMRDPKEALASPPDFSFSLPSFSLPSFGGEPAAPAAKKASAPAAATESEGPPALLLASLVLFSPLLLVQAVQVQTIARVAGQALSGAEPSGTVKLKK